jgi:glycosyltransferase involved in cell wall biosynthesis
MNVSICVPYQKEDDLRTWRESLPQKGIQIVACRTVVDNKMTGIIKEVIGKTDGLIGLQITYSDYENQYDFAEVRNYLDSHATGDWIIHIDSDERLAISHEEFWRQMYVLNESDADAAFLSIGGISNETKPEDVYRNRYCLAAMRIHRKKANIHWKGICHETLGIENKSITIADTDIFLFHSGYAIDEEKTLMKLERNGKLMVREYTREKSKRNWDYLINTFSHIHKLTR